MDGIRQSTGRRRSALAVASAVVLVGWAQIAGRGSVTAVLAQTEPPQRYLDPVFERVDSRMDIVYGKAVDLPSGDEVELRLDVYEPRGDTEPARPAFVFVHGGGFVAGDKSTGRQYCRLMAQRGYVALSIGYRLNQGDIWRDGIPAATADARQALRWLRAHAEEYAVDTTRITMGGSSAGAITSLFATYTDVAAEPPDAESSVAAVMDLWGGLYVEVDQLEAGEPPLVIIHGTNDTVVPFAEAERLRDRADAVGVRYAWHPIEGAGHAPWDPERHMAWTAEFFFEQLWQAHGATPTPTATSTATPTATPTATAQPAASASPTAPSATVPASPSATATGRPARTATATRAPEAGWYVYVPVAKR